MLIAAWPQSRSHRFSALVLVAASFGLGCSSTDNTGSGDAGVDAAVDAGEDLDGTAVADALGATDAPLHDDASDAAKPADASTCCALSANCSVNSDCCSGVCLWSGSGAKCVARCTSNSDCSSGCCSSGSCAPAAEWCQSTFACWPLGHGCANDPSACCAGSACVDIALEPNNEALVCSIPCASNSDCSSGCCAPSASGSGSFCYRPGACGHTASTCKP